MPFLFFRKDHPSLWEVWVGAHDNKAPANNVQVMSVSKIFKNPSWDASSVKNDVALMKLSDYVTLSNEVNTVCLPSTTHTAGNGFVTGWGEMQLGGQAGRVLLFLKRICSKCKFREIKERFHKATDIYMNTDV